MHTQSPFNTRNDAAWLSWRAYKLASVPKSDRDVRVHIADPSRLSQVEIDTLTDKCRKFNWVLFDTDPLNIPSEEQLKSMCAKLGLHRLDCNLRADDTGISSIQVKEQQGTRYIPYTDKQLSWHTDGYYNDTQCQIHGWALYCVRQAADGGDNEILDHELAYLYMRDADRAMVDAFMQPDVMTIPANSEAGVEIRPDHTGPVFSIDNDGNLHMRYSARKRNIIWKNDADTLKAVSFMQELLQGKTAPIIKYRLKPGEGLISNNVLHRRDSFTNGDSAEQKRLVWRARFYDRIAHTDVITG